jgi:hypothetical protein
MKITYHTGTKRSLGQKIPARVAVVQLRYSLPQSTLEISRTMLTCTDHVCSRARTRRRHRVISLGRCATHAPAPSLSLSMRGCVGCLLAPTRLPGVTSRRRRLRIPNAHQRMRLSLMRMEERKHAEAVALACMMLGLEPRRGQVGRLFWRWVELTARSRALMDLIEILVGIRATWLGWAPVPRWLCFSVSGCSRRRG